MAKLKTRNKSLIPDSEEKVPTHRWHTLSEYKTALEKAGGFFTLTAQILGVSLSAVSQKVAKSEYLQDVCQRVVEKNLDRCVVKLMQGVEAGESWAVQYYLRTKGRRYGFGEGVQIEADIRQTVRAGVLVVPGMMKVDDWEKMMAEHRQKRRAENAEQARLEHAKRPEETKQIGMRMPKTSRRYEIIEELEGEIAGERAEDETKTLNIPVTRG